MIFSKQLGEEWQDSLLIKTARLEIVSLSQMGIIVCLSVVIIFGKLTLYRLLTTLIQLTDIIAPLSGGLQKTLSNFSLGATV